MGLFSRKSTIQKKNQKQNVNSFGERLDRLDADGELPWGWIAENVDFTSRIQNEYSFFLNSWIKSKEDGVLKEYAALKSFVIYLSDTKALCDSKGVCFKKWFSDIIADQEYIDKRTSELQHIEENMDSLIQQEKRKAEIESTIVPTLKQTLLDIIRQTPGIIQTAIYKQFDGDVKPYIQSTLYFMEKEGLVTREKEGRSYKIYLTKKEKARK